MTWKFHAIGDYDNNATDWWAKSARTVMPRFSRPAMSARSAAAKPRNLYNFSGRGEVYSYTTIYDPPAGFEEQRPLHCRPGQAGRRPDGHRPTDRPGQRPVEIGTPVEMVTRRLRQDGDERG